MNPGSIIVFIGLLFGAFALGAVIGQPVTLCVIALLLLVVGIIVGAICTTKPGPP